MVSLNDCLACSGCVTSAETVLITQQSHEELRKVLEANEVSSGDQPQQPTACSIGAAHHATWPHLQVTAVSLRLILLSAGP